MKTAYSWLTCLCLIFGSGTLCVGKFLRLNYGTIHRSSRTSTSLPSKIIPIPLSSNISCLVDSFTCLDGTCIDSMAVCDGTPNCLDGSDETQILCTRLIPICPSISFRCKYGACVDYNAKCDGKKDCIDGSDESMSECSVTSPQVVPLILNRISFEPLCKDAFTCTSRQCIDSSTVCDGVANCLDGSDETENLCTQLFPSCPSFSFRCKYGACVDKNTICDGKKDCVDGSDENLPECTSFKINIPFEDIVHDSRCEFDEFACKSGECVEDTSICDGVKNCKDGSDEFLTLCKSTVCPSYTFKCRYGACISKANKCDGINHCVDGSDEERCSNHSTTNATLNHKITKKPISTTPYPITTTTINKKSCIIQSTEGIIYSYNDSSQNDILYSGTEVPNYDAVDVNCEEGYYKNSPQRLTTICLPTGKWAPADFPDLCLKMCPPVVSDSLEIKCTFNGELVDCSKPSIPGTKLKPKCKPTHSLPDGQIETPILLQCRNNGTWVGGQLYSCVPLCGRIFTPTQTLISNGAMAQYGTAPWNIGVYRANDNNREDYDMICGGTLISTNLAISAAHCFWQEGSNNKILVNVNNQYKIAVGKYTRNITLKDNEYTQIINVGLIYMHDDYNGVAGYNAQDIAVIVLPTKVNISNVVLPACIDWDQIHTVQPGSIGKIVGWGKTELMRPSPILLEAFLPFIDQTTCRKMYTNGFQYFVTDDKFCAGSRSDTADIQIPNATNVDVFYTPGQGVLEGDSGAGLTHKHGHSLHYLTGVVSIKDPQTDDSLAVFTDVRYHIKWIRDIYIKNSYKSDKVDLRPNDMSVR